VAVIDTVVMQDQRNRTEGSWGETNTLRQKSERELHFLTLMNFEYSTFQYALLLLRLPIVLGGF